VFSCGRSKVYFSDLDGICRLLDRKILAKEQLKIAEKAGIEFIPSARVKTVDLKNNSIRVESGDSLDYNAMIGADGSTSIIRRALGLRFKGVTTFQYISEERYDSPLTVYLDPKAIGWYAWHVPHPDFSIIGCGTLPDIHGTSEAREGLKKICEAQGYDLKGEFQAAPINLSYDGYRFRNVYLVGDAGGFTPQWRRHNSCRLQRQHDRQRDPGSRHQQRNEGIPTGLGGQQVIFASGLSVKRCDLKRSHSQSS